MGELTPPKEVSHFIRPTDDDPWRIVDLEFYRGYLSSMPQPAGDAGRFSFFLGYFFHLVTDNLWNRQIARPVVERFRAEFEADSRFIWEVKRDWYGLDFVYLYQHPDSFFYRVFLDCEYTEDYGLDFMPVEGLRRQLDHIKAYYRRADQMHKALCERPNIYLTEPEMDRFVEEATRRIGQVYHLFWEEGVDAKGCSTALDLLPA